VSSGAVREEDKHEQQQHHESKGKEDMAAEVEELAGVPLYRILTRTAAGQAFLPAEVETEEMRCEEINEERGKMGRWRVEAGLINEVLAIFCAGGYLGPALNDI
jgi:hypothetical protein